MLSGASGAALGYPRLPVSNSYSDQRSGQAAKNPPHAENPVTPQSARPVEPASETAKPNDDSGAKKADGEALSAEEERQVRSLKKSDTEVRAHEAAHAAAGGPYTGAPSLEFTTGPDGKRYATSGEVEIDSAPVRGNPEATIRKMDIVIRAALSPAEPSSQDLSVARSAQAQRSKAQSELFKQRAAEQDGDEGNAVGKDNARAGQPAALSGRIAEAAAAYAKTAESDIAEQAAELFAAAQERSIVV